MFKGTSVGRKQEVNGDYLYVNISTYISSSLFRECGFILKLAISFIYQKQC